MAQVIQIEEKDGFCKYAHPKAQEGKTHVIAYDDGSVYRVDTRWTFDNGYEVAINIVGADVFDPDNWALYPHLGEYEAWCLHDQVVQDPAAYFKKWQEKDQDEDEEVPS